MVCWESCHAKVSTRAQCERKGPKLDILTQYCNANVKQVIDYTLFQPGLFMEYLEYPSQTSKHLATMPCHVMIYEKRIIALEGHMDDLMTFTSGKDIARTVAAAVDYQGTWPIRGGICGDTISLKEIQNLGESILGGSKPSSSLRH